MFEGLINKPFGVFATPLYILSNPLLNYVEKHASNKYICRRQRYNNYSYYLSSRTIYILFTIFIYIHIN